MRAKFIKRIAKYLINKTAPEGGQFGDGVLIHLPRKVDIEKILSMNILNIIWNSNYTSKYSYSFTKEYLNFNRVLFTIDYNKAKKEFGQQNGTFRGEFFYKIWLFEYMGFEFLLFCDKPNADKGSSVEVIGNFENDDDDYIHNRKLYDAVIGFQQKLYNIFK